MRRGKTQSPQGTFIEQSSTDDALIRSEEFKQTVAELNFFKKELQFILLYI